MAMMRKSFRGLSQGGFHSVSYTEWGDPNCTHVVICVHGLTRNARDFDVLAQALASRCRVICPDIVGRGQSDWLANKQDYGYAQYLADMTALIARVTERLPADTQIDWVGTSMGGLIGMMLAAQSGSPIRRMVMNDVGPIIPKQALERIAMYVGMAPAFPSLDAAERYVRAVSAPFGPLSDSEWRHLTLHNVIQTRAQTWAMNYDPGIAAAFAALPSQDIDMWDVWERVSCAVLLLRGKQSDLLLESTAREMTERGPKARLIELDGIGHAPALMAKDQVDAVCSFLLTDS